ncbi:hypothetical protein [Bacteroides sp. 51]|uniref:hypothetical protein n=1 Tax=Bacteroides sp. 51 TaxID=2302938 RepID=UPI0013D72090|nr:hypothetical protein [Bacteroides sp. 51]NDV83958.1 hypothetical protein [Bacteroides sp. 51]
MGFKTQDIANVTENKKITLSNNPNFVVFESKSNAYTPVSISLTVRTTYAGSVEYPEQTKIELTETESGIKHIYQGTNESKNVNDTTFLLNGDRSVTAQNIRNTLLKDSFFSSNFEITIPFNIDGSAINNGYVIYITSKGGGSKYTFSFNTLNSTFISISGNPNSSSNSDTIDGGKGNTEIELDVYEDTGIFLGENDAPVNSDFGTYITTLSKSYYKESLWFETNTLMNKKIGYSTGFLYSDSWVNAGTSLNYRFVAKKYDGLNRIPFYISNVLYIFNGYDYTLNPNDISDYVYDGTKGFDLVKPLTNQPVKKYINGQTEYFNFIFSDAQHSINLSKEYNLGLTYRYFTQSGTYIITSIKHNQNRKLFDVVNTVRLQPDIESIELSSGKVVGYFTVGLSRNGSVVSDELRYDVIPVCYNKIVEFAFLNRLGGWETFNFNGEWSNEFKLDESTNIFKTLLPNYNVSDEIESVYSKTMEEIFTVQSSSISYETVEWLKELATSKAIYELSSKRYVIIQDINLKYNSNDNQYQIQMKYRYSDSINGN